MAASYRSTPPPGSAKCLNTDQIMFQVQDTISSRPFCGNAFSANSCGSLHIEGFENAADTPRPYHSHTDVPSFEKISPGMIDEMFYHGHGSPSDFQRLFHSSRNQSSLQHYGDLYSDDSRHFTPCDSLNHQYPLPEHIRISPEFLMFQANSRHFDRHANESRCENDYMVRSRGNFGVRNDRFGEPGGLNVYPFSGENMFLPMAFTRGWKEHDGSAELSANDFDMGPPHGVVNDAFESAARYRDQAYTQRKRSPFSASSSSSPTWEIDYSLPPFDETRTETYSNCHRPFMLDMVTERNRVSMASRLNGQSNITYGRVNRFCEQDLLSQFRDAKFFVIKSYSEDNVRKSIKHCVWASTKNGNKKLDAAYRETKTKDVGCPVFLLFSVNASGQFCGVAEMVGPVDFNTSVEYWQQDRWSGHFPVRWLIVKDVPNSLFRHIIIKNNDNKPVTNSRDTQEVGLEQGIEMLNIFKSCEMRPSLLDDFSFYQERQRVIQDIKARQNAVFESPTLSANSVPTYSANSLHDEIVMEMSKSFAEALALQHKPK